GPVARANALLALQFPDRSVFCPLGSCLHPFPRCASPGNLGQQRSRGISVLAGERAQAFGLHASSGIGGLAVLLRQGAVHGSALASGDRKTSAVAALAGGADPG